MCRNGRQQEKRVYARFSGRDRNGMCGRIYSEACKFLAYFTVLRCRQERVSATLMTFYRATGSEAEFHLAKSSVIAIHHWSPYHSRDFRDRSLLGSPTHFFPSLDDGPSRVTRLLSLLQNCA